MTVLHDRTDQQGSAEATRSDTSQAPTWPQRLPAQHVPAQQVPAPTQAQQAEQKQPEPQYPISGAWTLTLLVGLLAATAVVSLFLHGAAAAVCLVVGVLITVSVVPLMIVVEHARGHDDVP